MLDKADVVVQNLAPGAAARLGLGFDRLSAMKPEIIVCDISGYGADGPYRDKKAYDLLIQSEAGFLSVTGTPGRAVQGRTVDRRHRRRHVRLHQHPGRADAARRRPGAGQHIDVSMLESLAEWTSYPLYYAFDGAPPPPRTGAAHATIYPYGPFPTGDGGTVMLGLQNEREWVSFCEIVLQRPELATDPRFAGNAKPGGRAGRAAAAHRRRLRRADRRRRCWSGWRRRRSPTPG